MSTTPPDQPDLAPQEAPEPADQVAAAVLAVPGVHDLHGGLAGEVATLLPGRRVPGVRLRDGGCEIHLVLTWGAPVGETAAAVRAAVHPLVDQLPIDVVVGDVASPGATRDAAA